MSKINLQEGQKLIRAVRANPVLYDTRSRHYSDHSAKTKLWQSVASKCNMTEAECKSMWKNLRDCYRIYRNKGSSNPKGIRWKFYDAMDFIGPYIKDRNFDRSLNLKPPMDVENDVESHESGLERSININESEGEFTTIQYWNDSEPKTVNKEPYVAEEQSSEIELIPDSPVESEQESVDYVLPAAHNSGIVDKSLKMFFDAMFESTSQMPLNLQRSIKSKIFATVLECEEEAEKLRLATNPLTTQIKTEF